MKFVDKKDREWDLEILIGNALTLAAEMEIDLIEGEIIEIVQKIIGSPKLRIRLVWHLLRSQAEERDVTENQFWLAVGPSQITELTNCLQEALVNFIVAQHPEFASAVRATISKYGHLVSKQDEILTQVISDPSVTTKIEEAGKKFKERAKEELGKLSIDSLVPQEGFLTNTPSGS